jgi:hypothetical protein
MDAGEVSRLKFAEDESFLLGWGGLGEVSAVGGSENTSDGVSRSGVKVVGGAALGGKAGKDLSTLGTPPADEGGFFDFFRRRAMRDSWHDMQKIPCEVRAYLRFSILRLQFRHRKQFAQKAWSPVRMAKSSILFPQWLQLYVQLLHIKEPSPSSSRFASESRRVPHVLQRKQSICHRLPAVGMSVLLEEYGWVVWGQREGPNVSWGNAYQAQRPCLPRGSRVIMLVSCGFGRRGNKCVSHLSAPLARIHDIVLVDWALWIPAGGLHISLRRPLRRV